MTGRTKQTCYRRRKWWFRAGVLCCALLIPLSISTNVLRAAPLTRDGPLGDLSDPWNHIWLATQYRWGPPEGATETQETEWAIGFHTAMASHCGYYGKATEVRGIMKKSPYFLKGYLLIEDMDDIIASNCGQRLSTLKKVLGQKEAWENYLSATYPDGTAGLPSAPLVPEAERQKIEQYFKQNEDALKGQLGKYNERNGIAESSLGYEWYSINQIISLEVLSVDDKKGFVKLGFSVGRWRDVFEYVYEVQWVANRLRFVGHRKI